jgi:type II secretion system protein J
VRASPSRGGGFTLVELLVASSLAAGILGAAYLSLSSGLRSQRLVEARRDAMQAARVALALMTADLRHAAVLNEDFELIGMDRKLDRDEADNLDFASHRWEPRRPGEGDLCEVSYFVDRDPASGRISLFRRRDSSPDDQPLAGGSREELLRGLRGLRLEYYDGFEWFDSWGTEAADSEAASLSLRTSYNLYGLPDAVRITLWVDVAEGDPPLAFQTVVYLNLSGRGSSRYGSTSAGASQSATASAGGTEP